MRLLLLAYVKRDHDAIPTLRMMRLTKGEIGKRAESLASQILSAKIRIDLIDGESVIGGGAAPSSVLPTRLLAISYAGLSADELAARLRASDPPIIARVENGKVLLDLRTVFADQDPMIAAALQRIASYEHPHPNVLAVLYTIGHSTRTLDELDRALRAHQIQTLVDIRAFPMSRRLPQFNRDSLQQTLPAADIRYRWMKASGWLSQEDSRRLAEYRACATQLPQLCRLHAHAGIRAGRVRTVGTR